MQQVECLKNLDLLQVEQHFLTCEDCIEIIFFLSNDNRDYNNEHKLSNGRLSGSNDSSQYIQSRKARAVGKSSMIANTVSFQGQATPADSYRNSALARVRGGGSVAPKKKGSI